MKTTLNYEPCLNGHFKSFFDVSTDWANRYNMISSTNNFTVLHVRNYTRENPYVMRGKDLEADIATKYVGMNATYNGASE